MRVLYICHDHPRIQKGGAEVYAYDLYREVRERGGIESFFLARDSRAGLEAAGGKAFRWLGNDKREILWGVDHYDGFALTSRRKSQYTEDLDRLLRFLQPDLVHIQHSAGLGLDLIRQIRTSCPGNKILYTLHEYQPICHALGLMVRTEEAGGDLCDGSSPERCQACFPEIEASRFFLRKRMILRQFSMVDLFLAPSRFLRERYRQWGISSERIRVLRNGRRLPSPEDLPSPPASPGHFSFFGQVKHHKGVHILIEALSLLLQQGSIDVRLTIHGEYREGLDARFDTLVKDAASRCAGAISFAGAYEQSEIASRMQEAAWVVVPSIWWENAPLVIGEAFAHGRPVLCSGIGGMAEMVTHDVSGLHFQPGDPADLARAMRMAASEEGLWDRLQSGIPKVLSIQEAADQHLEVYRSLVAGGGGDLR